MIPPPTPHFFTDSCSHLEMPIESEIMMALDFQGVLMTILISLT